ncbi:MAG: ribosome-binding factor A [Clostridia bacterium]
MSYQRIDRISEQVRREVDRIIREELSDPRIQGTYSITRAEVTRDLSYAKIYVSILEEASREPMMEAGTKKNKESKRLSDLMHSWVALR